jgi:muconolactone delta-isomerase
MKFLVITRTKDTFSMLPLDMQAKLMEASAAYIDKYKKAGVCKEVFSIASIHGTASIWDVESGEKGNAIYVENPQYGFQDFEMYAMSDFDAQMKVQTEMYRQLLAKK